MIRHNLSHGFFAVPRSATCANGMYLPQINDEDEPYGGVWCLIAPDGYAVDGEHGGRYIYRSLNDVIEDHARIIAQGECSTCGPRVVTFDTSSSTDADGCVVTNGKHYTETTVSEFRKYVLVYTANPTTRFIYGITLAAANDKFDYRYVSVLKSSDIDKALKFTINEAVDVRSRLQSSHLFDIWIVEPYSTYRLKRLVEERGYDLEMMQKSE